jgi:signal transduction histidine kinase
LFLGISAENLKLMFQEGVQFDANKMQAGGGSGLGLWIAKGCGIFNFYSLNFIYFI